MAQTLDDGGKILSIDKDLKCHEIAKEFACKHPRGHLVNFVQGDARETLHGLVHEVN